MALRATARRTTCRFFFFFRIKRRQTSTSCFHYCEHCLSPAPQQSLSSCFVALFYGFVFTSFDQYFCARLSVTPIRRRNTYRGSRRNAVLLNISSALVTWNRCSAPTSHLEKGTRTRNAELSARCHALYCSASCDSI